MAKGVGRCEDAPLTHALGGRAAALALPSRVGTFCAGTSKCK